MVLLSHRKPMSELLTPRHMHDLGKFLLANTMLFAYFSFSQFLITWAGNLPDEIPWYKHRLAGGWESLGLFVKYGMMTDDKFLEKAGKFHIMEDVKGGKFYTLEEYRTATEALQKNKEGKLVILYTSNPVQQDSYIQQAQAKGYTVVKLETIVDAAFINQMESKWENVHFIRVDADIAQQQPAVAR